MDELHPGGYETILCTGFRLIFLLSNFVFVEFLKEKTVVLRFVDLSFSFLGILKGFLVHRIYFSNTFFCNFLLSIQCKKKP